jgi:hypothetical protein
MCIALTPNPYPDYIWACSQWKEVQHTFAVRVFGLQNIAHMEIIKHDHKTHVMDHKFSIAEIWEDINNQMKNDYKFRLASTGS